MDPQVTGNWSVAIRSKSDLRCYSGLVTRGGQLASFLLLDKAGGEMNKSHKEEE